MTVTQDRCHAVIPAAGIGSRMAADIPKQYLEVEGKTLLEHSVNALLQCESIASVTVALLPDDNRAKFLNILNHPKVSCVTGGKERADSVLAGLQHIVSEASATDWVLVHDAARPCVLVSDIERLIREATENDCGAILAQPVVDTMKQADANGKVTATLDRNQLWRAQTPQMFRAKALQQALSQAMCSGVTITDEAAAMEWAGEQVQLVSGSSCNIKVTVPDDLALASWYINRSQSGGS